MENKSKINKVDMSPDAIVTRLRETAELYRLNLKIKSAKKIDRQNPQSDSSKKD